MSNLKKKRSLAGRAKELSWLDFNGRVLAEAEDPNVPLLERFKFLGIYSNNLDEFFRVRVATLNRLASSPRKKAIGLLGHDPRRTLRRVQSVVVTQRRRFERAFDQLLRELPRQGIHLIDEARLTVAQKQFVTDYFRQTVRPKLFPIMMNGADTFPDLKDRAIYLAVVLTRSGKKTGTAHALIEMPTDTLSRFVILPKTGKRTHIILLDDIIRYNLKEIFAPFGYSRARAYTIKLTRDAELDIDDDVMDSYVRKLRRSLHKRKEGQPVSLVHDAKIPRDLLRVIVKHLELRPGDAPIAGGRYHNFKDFMKFPPVGRQHLRYLPAAPIPHPYLRDHGSILEKISRRDMLLHFPYHSFDHIIDLLREASIDPRVRSIKITLYRTAPNSSVVNALINAAKNGKSVVAVVELQARFDEEANIRWATELQEAGAKVDFGVPGLKVHAKLCLITREDGQGLEQFAVVATGNFNEDTARVYTDHFLLTANRKITESVADLFEFLEKNYKVSPFRHLLVSPFNTRRKLSKLIQTEIDNARDGKPAEILLKLNHLIDSDMIRQLYNASQAGVLIRLLVRGMFTLEPGLPGLSDNIEARRLVDKYLEHSRVMFFANGGKELCYIGSADWMPRNLDRRVEAFCPVLDESLRKELRDILELQWQDDTKSTNLAGTVVRNGHRRSGARHRAQHEIYAYLRGRRR